MLKDWSVPVSIDSVWDSPPIVFSRCTYLTIECDEPGSLWRLGTSGSSLSFVMLGLIGIVIARAGDSGPFTSSQDLDALYDMIESWPGLDIGSGEIWLPRFCFDDSLRPRRGDVYRVESTLFRDAYAFQDGQVQQEDFCLVWRDQGREQVQFSSAETSAFREWRTLQLKLARNLYPKDSTLALRSGGLDATDRGGKL